MNKETEAFIKDLKAVFDKHDCSFEVWDDYGDEYIGKNLEIHGQSDEKGNHKIFIDSLIGLEKLLK